MLDRIEMDILKMLLEIYVIANAMLVKALLPHATISLAQTGKRWSAFEAASSKPRSCERLFHRTYAQRIAIVLLRQFPQHMKMVREQDDAQLLKGPHPLNILYRLSEKTASKRGRQYLNTLVGDEREEVDASLHTPTPVERHVVSLPRGTLRHSVGQ